MALGLLVAASTFAVLFQLMARPPDGLVLEDPIERIRKASGEGTPAALVFAAILVAGFVAAFLFAWRVLADLRKGQEFAPFPARLKEFAPWRIASFGLVFAAQLVVLPLALLPLLPRPVLMFEGDAEPFPLSATQDVYRFAGAPIEFKEWPQHGWVVTGRPGFPAVDVNGERLASGEARLLARHDRIDVNEWRSGLHAVVEMPSLARKLAVGCIQSAATIGLVLLVVWRTGGKPRDLGLTLEGAPSEVGRGASRYLASWPLLIAATFGSLGLCKLLGLPFEDHPLLREIAHERENRAFTIALLFVYAAGLGPLTEEIVFRGLLVRALLTPLRSRVAAVTISSFFFASLHPGFASLLPIFVVGSLFSSLFVTSKQTSLVAPITAHVLFNAVNIALEVALSP